MPAISIKAEPIIEIGHTVITNSLFTSILVTFIFFIIAFFYYSQSRSAHKTSFYYLIQAVLKGLYSFFSQILGKNMPVFFPILGAFFIFILLQNWFGLLPGVGSFLVQIEEHGKTIMVPILRGGNADLNTTVGLGLVSVILIQAYGIRFLGFFGYISKFINLKGPIDFFIGILEIISEFSKVLSFSFRLFGNIFAGEVLLTIVAFLVPVLASFPFLMLEIFVGFVQALVFTMLTAVFLSMAIQPHH